MPARRSVETPHCGPIASCASGIKRVAFSTRRLKSTISPQRGAVRGDEIAAASGLV
jgi:hypothetical protein